jgi:hypothetical protein
MKPVKWIAVKVMFTWGCILPALTVSAQPYRLLSPEVVDLGQVLDGKSIEGEVRFINTGIAQLRIGSVQTSCGCTAVLPGEMNVAPNDTAVVRFVLKTTGMHGLVRKALNISFADHDIEGIVVYIQARVHSEIELKPSFVVFQGIPFRSGSVYADTIQITNASGRPLRVLNVHSDTDLIRAEFFPVSIPPDGEARIRIILKPKKAEYKNAILTIETDNPNKPKILAPVLIDVVE